MFTGNHEMFFGWGFMWIFWILLVVALVFVVRAVAGGGNRSARDRNETPVEILKKRLASGEIDEQEFNRKRKILNS